jgi:hypothetical protein
MSVEAMAIVLHHSQAKLGTKMILLGIANHDGDGGAWPSIETLATYANCTERYVREQIRALEEMGELSVEIQAGGSREMDDRRRPNRYRVLVRCPAECDRTTNHRVSKQPGTMVPPSASPQVDPGGTMVPSPDPGGNHSSAGRNPSSLRGEPQFPQTILEPPSNRGGARRPSLAPVPDVEQPPPVFCPDHPGGTAQPCRACAVAGQALAVWQRNAARDRERARHEAIARADAEARRTAAPPPIDLLRSSLRKRA